MFLALVAGCEGEEPLSVNAGTDYFPLQKGLYHLYSVNEVRHQVSSEPEVLNYEVMTEVVDSFPSAESGYTFVVHRSRRTSEGDPWQVLDTWSVRKADNMLIVLEGSTPFVKIQFPVRAGVRWNGNLYNTMGEDEYELKSVGETMTVDGMNFEKTMTVEQERSEDLIVFRDIRSEVYALDVGLIYREVIQLDYCTDDPCLGQQKIDHGVELRMAIKAYGKH